MVLFKINGERNSGTNFLHHILQKNNFPTYSQTMKENTLYHWKHGVPSIDYKELDEKVVDLFIFRNLEDWLKSFSKNPHHLKRRKNFKDFLTFPQISTENKFVDYRTNKRLNEDDNGKTIFQIREYKFNKIMEYKKNNKDVILVNLSFIQNDKNLSQFLHFLHNKYMKEETGAEDDEGGEVGDGDERKILKVKNFKCNMKHTKDQSNNKNRTYNIDINEYIDIIDSNKNEEIENFINSLSFI